MCIDMSSTPASLFLFSPVRQEELMGTHTDGITSGMFLVL